MEQPASLFRRIVFLGYKESDLDAQTRASVEELGEESFALDPASADLSEVLREADCILLRLGGALDQTLIDLAPNLRYVGMLGTGYGRVDAAYAASKGVCVTNLAGYSTNGVAEFTVGVLLNHFRELCRAQLQAAREDYSEATFTGSELHGKQVGIIGLGRIGTRLADILNNGFGCKVLYWSRSRKPSSEEKGYIYAPLAEILASSDITSIHVPYTQETAHLLGREQLALVKPGSVMVNTSPMEVIDVPAVAEFSLHKPFTLILDHSDELSPDEIQTLRRSPSIELYPPIGYTTVEATSGKFTQFVQQMRDYLRGDPTGQVN